MAFVMTLTNIQWYTSCQRRRRRCATQIFPIHLKRKRRKKRIRLFIPNIEWKMEWATVLPTQCTICTLLFWFFFFAVLLTKLEPFSRLTSSWILSDFLRRKSESQKMLKVSIFVLGFRNELWRNSCNYAKFVKGDVQHPSLQKKFFRQKFLAWCVFYIAWIYFRKLCYLVLLHSPMHTSGKRFTFGKK